MIGGTPIGYGSANGEEPEKPSKNYWALREGDVSYIAWLLYDTPQDRLKKLGIFFKPADLELLEESVDGEIRMPEGFEGRWARFLKDQRQTRETLSNDPQALLILRLIKFVDEKRGKELINPEKNGK